MADSDTPASPEAEARAQRRRWLSLAEIVGDASVAIAGLSLWNSYDERQDAKQAETKAKVVAPPPLVLRGTLVGDDQLTVTGVRGEVFQAQTISLPTALGVAPLTTHDDEGLIVTKGFDKALKAAIKDRSGGDGEALLPVLIDTRYLVDGDLRRDRAVYDIAYVMKGGLFGSDVDLRGLSFVERAKDGRARIDALWQQRHPTISSLPKK